MQRFKLRYPTNRNKLPVMQSLDVPDIVTALVVAEIVGTGGTLEIRDGEDVLAKVVKQGSDGAAFWRVN